MGVASLFPIHKFDNAFGGVRFDGGTFGVAINAANLKQTGQFWQIEPCPAPEHDNEQATALPGDAGIIGAGLLGSPAQRDAAGLPAARPTATPAA